MAVGKIYDSNETTRIKELLSTQKELLSNLDNSKENANKTVLKYAILIGGSAVILLLLNYIVTKKS